MDEHDERVERIQRILDCSGSLFHSLNPGRDRAWLSVELTMPQLKALICAAKTNGATSGHIARSLGVGLSTMTGIVDRLAEQNLVTRREDPDDRRIARVLPTAEGRTLVDELLRYRNEVITEILSRLDANQLRIVEGAVTYLSEAVAEINLERRAEQEVVA
jgi:DNA-binding MarR family transcriptional regulator